MHVIAIVLVNSPDSVPETICNSEFTLVQLTDSCLCGGVVESKSAWAPAQGPWCDHSIWWLSLVVG